MILLVRTDCSVMRLSSPSSTKRPYSMQNAWCCSMAVLGATTRSQQAFLLCGTPVHESRISRIGGACLPCQVHTRLTFRTCCAIHSVDLNLEARESRHPYAARLPSPLHTWSKTPESALRATSNVGVITDGEDEAVSLGTMEFRGDVDLKLFQSLLFQASMMTNCPIPTCFGGKRLNKFFEMQNLLLRTACSDLTVQIAVAWKLEWEE